MFSRWVRQKCRLKWHVISADINHKQSGTFRVEYIRGKESGTTDEFTCGDNHCLDFDAEFETDCTMYISKADSSIIRPKIIKVLLIRSRKGQTPKIFGRVSIDVSKYYSAREIMVSSFEMESGHSIAPKITCSFLFIKDSPGVETNVDENDPSFADVPGKPPLQPFDWDKDSTDQLDIQKRGPSRTPSPMIPPFAHIKDEPPQAPKEVVPPQDLNDDQKPSAPENPDDKVEPKNEADKPKPDEPPKPKETSDPEPPVVQPVQKDKQLPPEKDDRQPEDAAKPNDKDPVDPAKIPDDQPKVNPSPNAEASPRKGDQQNKPPPKHVTPPRKSVTFLPLPNQKLAGSLSVPRFPVLEPSPVGPVVDQPAPEPQPEHAPAPQPEPEPKPEPELKPEPEPEMSPVDLMKNVLEFSWAKLVVPFLDVKCTIHFPVAVFPIVATILESGMLVREKTTDEISGQLFDTFFTNLPHATLGGDANINERFVTTVLVALIVGQNRFERIKPFMARLNDVIVDLAKQMTGMYVAKFESIANRFMTAKFEEMNLITDFANVFKELEFPFTGALNAYLRETFLRVLDARLLIKLTQNPHRFTYINSIAWKSFLGQLDAESNISLPGLSQAVTAIQMGPLMVEDFKMKDELCPDLEPRVISYFLRNFKPDTNMPQPIKWRPFAEHYGLANVVSAGEIKPIPVNNTDPIMKEFRIDQWDHVTNVETPPWGDFLKSFIQV